MPRRSHGPLPSALPVIWVRRMDLNNFDFAALTRGDMVIWGQLTIPNQRRLHWKRKRRTTAEQTKRIQADDVWVRGGDEDVVMCRWRKSMRWGLPSAPAMGSATRDNAIDKTWKDCGLGPKDAYDQSGR